MEASFRRCESIPYKLTYPSTNQRAVESLEPTPPTSASGNHAMAVLNDVTDDAVALESKLTAFESAWHIVRLACSQLQADCALARSFTVVS